MFAYGKRLADKNRNNRNLEVGNRIVTDDRDKAEIFALKMEIKSSYRSETYRANRAHSGLQT